MGREKAGQLLVPVAMHGQQTQLVLNTGSSWSTLQQSLTSGLQIKSSESRLMNGTGHNVAQFVSVHDLQIGQLSAPAVDFYVLAPNAPETPGIGGSLGANLLTWADVEIDPGQGKLSFFSQVHCPGAVVHWPHQDLIKIPLQISEDGKITILVNLDDKPMRAVVSTGASRSVLFSDAAEDQFGLKPASPRMEKVTDGTGKDNSDIYNYRFRRLALQDLAFGNPILRIIPNVTQRDPDYQRALQNAGIPEFNMILGIQELRKLHIYIAFKEKMLYATTVAGDAAVAKAAAGSRSVN